MSSITTSVAAEQAQLHRARPSFFGLVGGEFFKVFRMWSTWITLVLFIGAVCLPYIVSFSVSTLKDNLARDAAATLYDEMGTNLMVLRVFIGFFLIILTAMVFGREYQLGTIRILLARGVGRLQLLFAKLLTVAIIGLVVLLLGLALNIALGALLMSVKIGNFDAISKVPDFWSNTWLYIVTILVSMGSTVLMTTAVTVLGRSLAFGLSAGMAWFPADNIGVIFMSLGYRLTKAPFWQDITAYFLGPNLNQMPAVVLPAHTVTNYTAPPLVTVDGTHTLLVALVYSAIFLAASIVLTWKRDVKE